MIMMACVIQIFVKIVILTVMKLAMLMLMACIKRILSSMTCAVQFI